MRLLILWNAIHSSHISSLLLKSPNISHTEGTSSPVPQQQDTLHMAAMSLYEPLKHLSQNVHTSHSITQTITADLSKSCHVFYQPGGNKQLNITITNECNTYLRQQKSLNIQVNAFSTEHNWWLCTIPLWQATQMVSHLARHTCRITSRSAEPLSASSNTEVTVPHETWRCTWLYTLRLKHKVQTETILTP